MNQLASNKLAMTLIDNVGKSLTQLPGVDAVCVTLVGSRKIPLGAIICRPEKLDSDTLIQSIARMSDHIEVVTQKLLGKETDGIDTDGQDSPSLGKQGQAKSLPDSGDRPVDQEDHRSDEAPEAHAG